MSGEVLLDSPDAPKQAEDLLQVLVLKSPPPAGKAYQFVFRDESLQGDLPRTNPLELTAIVVEAWSGLYHLRSVGYGFGARVHYSTRLSFKTDGSVSFTASGHSGRAGSTTEAAGSWKAGEEPGSLIVCLSSFRTLQYTPLTGQSSTDPFWMYKGSDWSEWSQFEQHLSYTKGGQALRLNSNEVVAGKDFDRNHGIAGNVFQQVSCRQHVFHEDCRQPLAPPAVLQQVESAGATEQNRKEQQVSEHGLVDSS